MKRKTVGGTMGLARWVLIMMGPGLAGCEFFLEEPWNAFKSRPDGAGGGMASGSTGTVGAGGGGSACVAGGMAGAGQSCGGGSNQTCGMTGSCCDNVLVPGGTDSACPKIDPFYLDTYEVTVGRFKEFVEAVDGYGTPQKPQDWTGLWAADATALGNDLKNCMGTTYASADHNMPVNCVTWYEAHLFCKWDQGAKGRLPTVGELRRAAHGCDPMRKFPWGDSPTPAEDSSRATFTPETIGLVASKPLGKGQDFGHFHLVGNVAEWVQYDGACGGELFATANKQTTVGGSYQDVAGNLEIEKSILPKSPGVRDPAMGFRCAREL